MGSFYSVEELKKFKFRKLGENVHISRKASIYGAENISIDSNVRIDDFSILSGEIVIGRNVHIAAYCGLFAGDKGIVLEEFSGLSSRVTIYAISDDYSGEFLTNPTVPDKYKNVTGGLVKIKKHSIIGASTVVLPNIIIGEGVAIGAHSLVIKNCEGWGIYAGVPVKKIKNRKNNILKKEKQYLEGEKNV